MRAIAIALVLGSLVSCGEPPSAPAAPGQVNTGGRPTPERTNTHGKGDPRKTNLGGKPSHPGKTVNVTEDPVGGAVNLGGAPDFAKTNLPGFGRDAGK